jgi:hypothetical protein
VASDPVATAAPRSAPTPAAETAPPLLDTGSGFELRIDASTGAVLGTGPGVRLLPEQVESALPRSVHTVRREVMTLHDASFASWPVAAAAGDRYLLQYVCVGAGQLRVQAAGAEQSSTPPAAPCDGSLFSAELAADGPMLVSAARLGPEPIEIGVQLIALPRGGH